MMEPRTMSNELATFLFGDIDNDDIVQPRAACLPTQLITFEDLQLPRPFDLNEEYYRRLSEALDETLNS